ncbi:hypothetical protein C8R47DRAFT_1226731 [Mycena vitilis]|nr:hypothetical protein C8R47DRAFT_1226731 [Mycena vitilis]
MSYAQHIFDGSSFLLRAMARVPTELWNITFKDVWEDREDLESALLVCRHWHYILTTTPSWNPVLFDNLREEGILARVGYILRSSCSSSSPQISFSMEKIHPHTLHAVFVGLRPVRLADMTVSDFYPRWGREIDADEHIARSMLRLIELPRIENLCIIGRQKHLYGTTLGATFGDSFSLHHNFLPDWVSDIPNAMLRLDWRLAEDPISITLIETIEPETHFLLPWKHCTFYAESETLRAGGGNLPASHLEKLQNITVLSLAGVFLPPHTTLPVLTEFNYIIPWGTDSFLTRDPVFHGVHFPAMDTLRLKGGVLWGDESQRPVIGHAMNTSLEEFLGRCRALETLQLAFEIPLAVSVLLDHLRACHATIQDIDIPLGNREILGDAVSLFEALTDPEFAPCLRSLRLPEPLGYSEQWWNGSALDALCTMADVRFQRGFEKLDLRRSTATRKYEETQWMKACNWHWYGMPYRTSGRDWMFSNTVRAEIEETSRSKGWDILVEATSVDVAVVGSTDEMEEID